MDFFTSIRTVFSKYATFEGRASRPEFWWFFLFSFLVSWALNLTTSEDNPVLPGIWNLVVFLPSLAVAARRLHDTNRSSWKQLWALTIIGLVPVIYWLAQPATPGPNRFDLPGDADETDLS